MQRIISEYMFALNMAVKLLRKELSLGKDPWII